MKFPTTTLLLAALLATAGFGQAQSAEKVVLTMPKIEAAVNGFTNLGELFASNPDLKKQAKEIEKTLPEGTKDDDRFGILLTKLQAKDARVGAAFSKANVSPQEAASTLQMLVGCAMGDAMLKPGQPIPKEMDPVIAENLKFYRQHKEEIAPQMKKFQGLSEKLGGSDDQ